MKNCLHNTKRILPFLGFSILTGFLSALFGMAFKLGAEWAIHLSADVYTAVGKAPLWSALLVLGVAGLGLVSGCILSRAQSCKGGGIPSSVAAVRGIVDFKWLQSILILPFSALITFLSGLPLGTEGPCVQMGTAIGDGVMQRISPKKHRPWRRYVMTGGGAAGFSIATAAPISAIAFSLEELQKCFSPLLLAGVSVAVMSSQVTAQILTFFGIPSGKLFHLQDLSVLPAKLLFIPLLIGILCGLGSVGFTRFYHCVEKTVHIILSKRSPMIVFPILFVATALVGLCLGDVLGTGHGLVDKLFQPQTPWYLLILIFLLRAIFMMVANTAGVTGGVFLPTLAFGAILGSLCAEALTAMGLLEQQQYLLTVVLGITAFLGATSRIPLTACIFAVEALGGINNALAIVITATVAYLIAELSGVEDFTDAVIEAKERSIRKGAKAQVVETTVTVSENAFVDGKKPGDILWPHSCVVVSVEHPQERHHSEVLQSGDTITLRYETYDPAATAKELAALTGSQITVS